MQKNIYYINIFKSQWQMIWLSEITFVNFSAADAFSGLTLIAKTSTKKLKIKNEWMHKYLIEYLTRNETKMKRVIHLRFMRLKLLIMLTFVKSNLPEYSKEQNMYYQHIR